MAGYLPAPFVYGAIYDAGEGGNSRYALATLMFSPAIPVLTLYTAAYFIVKNDVLGYKK